VNGRLLPPEDVEALTGALVDVLGDAPGRARMRAAIPATLDSFAAPAVSARWNALFQSLTGA
jgi:hypothetical protein